MLFFGRQPEIDWLMARYERCRSGEGQLVIVRGRRQVGKSTLIERFASRSEARVVYFQAAQGASEVEQLVELHRIAFGDGSGAEHRSIEAAVRELATADEEPLIVVLDEFPWLIASSPSVEGAVQRLWDRTLRRRKVMLVLVGSDLRMMKALSEYDRPLYGRGEILEVSPLSPSEVASATETSADEALSTYIVTGGFPQITLDRREHGSLKDFLFESYRQPTSRLIVTGERVIAAEFPEPGTTRAILRAIGAGLREHSAIGNLTGLSSSVMQRALESLVAKEVVRRSEPFSTSHRGRTTRYYVSDPYLRFWLRWVAPALPEIERGRGDLAAAAMWAQFAAYRGIAVEPVVREALLRLDPGQRPADCREIGGFWTRDGRIEVDLVGGPDGPVASSISLIGSIKWREAKPFDHRDLAALAAQIPAVPGASVNTPLVAVSRTGHESLGPTVWRYGPDELVDAW